MTGEQKQALVRWLIELIDFELWEIPDPAEPPPHPAGEGSAQGAGANVQEGHQAALAGEQYSSKPSGWHSQAPGRWCAGAWLRRAIRRPQRTR
jgi:hypothetical protein